MATYLYIISNINTPKEEVLANKEIYLKKLKALQLEPTSYLRIIDNKETWLKSEGDWKYELPGLYDDATDSMLPDNETKEIIYYSSPFVFSVTVYENCLELSTIYKYRYLYENDKELFVENFNEFRKNVYDIISIFGGTEIIYLADNGCNKLGKYLELQVWEGHSFNQVKTKMLNDGTPIERDYNKLKLENLNYCNIKEYVFDDFKDLQQ